METLQSVTPLICNLFGIPTPEHSTQSQLAKLIHISTQEHFFPSIERCLVFAPDALGALLFDQYPTLRETVQHHAPAKLKLRSVLPPVTPVCFGSMFTGAPPEKHGIQHYEKRTIELDSLFDTCLRNEKSCAIVAVEKSSMAILFSGKPMDYYIEPDDNHVIERSLELLASNKHDLVVVYNQLYDDCLHKTSPNSELAIAAMEQHIADFERLSNQIKEYWNAHNYAVLFTPDHGGHFDSSKQCGTHGLDIPEDMFIYHFMGLYPKAKSLEHKNT